ncbi:MAG: hypothetical protein ABI950_03700 [Solirubrobacteraceae bacterium]
MGGLVGYFVFRDGDASVAYLSSVFGPEDTEWGTRRARVLDLDGYEWSFGTYQPGQAWG